MRILLVEDDEQQLSLLHHWLTTAGHEVTDAETAEAAINAPGHFDLVLCDYRLDGPHTGIEVRAGRASLGERFVMISGAEPPEPYEGQWVLKPLTRTKTLALLWMPIARTP